MSMNLSRMMRWTCAAGVSSVMVQWQLTNCLEDVFSFLRVRLVLKRADEGDVSKSAVSWSGAYELGFASRALSLLGVRTSSKGEGGSGRLTVPDAAFWRSCQNANNHAKRYEYQCQGKKLCDEQCYWNEGKEVALMLMFMTARLVYHLHSRGSRSAEAN